MNEHYVTNLSFFAQCLSECLDGFEDLAANCPEPDTVENYFLWNHVASVIEFLHYELFLTNHRLEVEVNDD